MCIFWVILRKNWIFFILLLLVVVGCSSSSDACSNIFGRREKNDFFLILFENGVLRWRVYFCRKALRSLARSRVLYFVSDGFLQYTAVVNKWRKIYKRQIAHGNESISPFILYPLSILLLFGVECISREREGVVFPGKLFLSSIIQKGIYCFVYSLACILLIRSCSST